MAARQADLERAKAQVAVSQAELQRARVQVAVSQDEFQRTRAQVAVSQADLQRVRAQVAVSQADLQHAQTQVTATTQTANAATASVATAIGKKAQAEGMLRQALTTPTQVAISKSKHASAQADIQKARAKVAEQQSILQSLYVTSPITGIVTTRIRDTGENVIAGSPILEVVNLDRLYLKAYVPEYQIGKVRLGLPVQVYVDAFPNHPFDATVKYIASTAEFSPKEVQTLDRADQTGL